MRCLSPILVLPLALVGTTFVSAQDAERGRSAEDRDDGSAAREEIREDRNARLEEDERDEPRAARRARPAARRERATRGPRRDGEARRNVPPERRPADGRRRGPSARMLLARFDRDGDRELNLRELRQLVDRMAAVRGFGPGSPRRGPSFGGRGGPRPDGPRNGRGFAGREDRAGNAFRNRTFDRPRGSRPDGMSGRRPGRFEEPGGEDDRGERRRTSYRREADD